MLASPNACALTTSEATTKLEAALDRTYFRNPLPHQNGILAIWYYLTVSEDFQRNLFSDMGEGISFSRIIFYLDRNKYAMRHTLDRILLENRDKTWANVPRKALMQHYDTAGNLMFAAVDYALASQVCGALHTGTAIATEEADAWRISLDESHHDKAYGALELFSAGQPPTLDFATLLFHWVRNPAEVPSIVGNIANSIKVRKGLISYRYSQAYAVELALELSQPPDMIPEAWNFSWGSKADAILLLNALGLRCMYHMVAIHFGANTLRLRGGGFSSIVLVLSRSQLVADLVLMSSLDSNKIELFMADLTWGQGTSTPDPALQPLIPLGGDTFAIPCIHVLSSSQQRNLLSLMARTQPRSFDAQSRLFELDMVAALMASQHPMGVVMKPNILLRFDGEEEEIDLLLIDLANRRLLVCELRWMLGPGDPREVQNRKKVCLEKVVQVRRKTEWVSTRAPDVVVSALQLDHISHDGASWITSGVVVIAGFGGTLSSDSKYPIIPARIFTLGMAKAASLQALAVWCEQMTWLPREGEHFSIVNMEISLDDSKPLELQGMEVPDSASDFMVQVHGDL